MIKCVESLAFGEVVRIDALHLIDLGDRDTDVVVDHEFSQLVTVDEDDLAVADALGELDGFLWNGGNFKDRFFQSDVINQFYVKRSLQLELNFKTPICIKTTVIVGLNIKVCGCVPQNFSPVGVSDYEQKEFWLQTIQ